MDDNLLKTLHDHHKDSFFYIREREILRDRYFIVSILLLGLLFLQVNYPSHFISAVGALSIFGAEVEISALPFAAILSITWTLQLVITLRYCQSSICVDRQYTYLHRLEDEISALIGSKGIYCREGQSYLEEYPAFAKWAWLFYVAVFPLIVFLSVVVLLWTELTASLHHWPYKIFDLLAGIGVISSYALYRLVPAFQKKKAKD